MPEQSRRRPALAAVIQRAPNVAWRDCGDEVVILELQARRALGLNAFGTQVWALLDGQRDLASIADQLASGDASTRDELRERVRALASGLLAQSCVTLQDAGAQLAADATPELSPLVPGIAWTESLEESGVFAGCAKDEGGNLGEQCLSSPSSLAS